MSRLPNYRKNSVAGMRDMLNGLKRQQNRSQFSPRVSALGPDGEMTREQSLGNDVLEGALIPWAGSARSASAGFSVTTSWQTVATLTVPVPDGFTRMLVTTMTTSANCRNGSGSVDWLFATSVPNANRTDPGGSTAWVMASGTTPPDAQGYLVDPRTAMLVDLAGEFTVDLSLHSGLNDWGSHTGNQATLVFSGLFLR